MQHAAGGPQAAAAGWLVVRNTTPGELTLLVEPWGVGCRLGPGQAARVYLREPGGVPEVEFGDGVISLFAAASRIEVDGAVVFDGAE